MNALNATVGNMFRKTGEAKADYPEQPFTIQRKKEKRREKTEAEEEQEAVWAKAWMSSFVQAGKHWGKKK